jgi:hypothetical protein
MPIAPRGNESQNDFISRCVKEEMDSGYEQDRALAICYSKWRESKKSHMVKQIKRMKKAILPSLQKCRDTIRDEIRKKMEENGHVVLRKDQAQELQKSLDIGEKELNRYSRQVRRSIEREKRSETQKVVKEALKGTPEPTQDDKKKWADSLGVTYKEIDNVIYQLGQNLKGEPDSEDEPESEEIEEPYKTGEPAGE